MTDIKKESDPRDIESIRLPEVPVTPRSSEQNPEVSSWMEKIEKRFARVPNATSDVSDDSVVVQPNPQSQQPPVTLPINKTQMQVGQKAKTDTGIAWLVTWAIRQIKMLSRMGRKVRLQDMPEINQTNKPTN